MREELHEFEVGKRYLANMMGLNPDNITQTDIDVGALIRFTKKLHHLNKKMSNLIKIVISLSSKKYIVKGLLIL